jgi:large subunit ribosomal protein L25
VFRFLFGGQQELVMAESVVLVAQPRSSKGSREARRLRDQGMVPGVVYGHGEATLSVSLGADALYKAIRQGARVVDLEQGGKLEKALIRELQWDPLGHDILHVDFARVAADERITIEVRLELRGTAPGVTAGGSLDQPLHDLKVECLAISVPESIRVNIGELQIEGVIHVRDLVLPEGVVAVSDPDAVVVQVNPPVVEAAAAPAAPAEGEQAEPEVIGRQRPVEEEEAEK